MRQQVRNTLDEIRAAGLYKNERRLTTPQAAHIGTGTGPALNFCANNYLGLADHPDVIEAAKDALDRWGFGMASVRFICGTQTQHVDLENRLADFLRTDDAILYSSCFDANGGVFETLFGAEDAIISDELNHASIIDGVRLSKAARYRYRNADLDDLRAQLEAVEGARQRVIVTDGVFSMDGFFAPLPGICDLAEEYGALVFVDDSHAVGFVGENGRGTPSCSGSRTASTSGRAPSARPWVAPPAATWRPTRRSWTCCGSDPVPTCSATPWPRRWWPARWRPWNWWPRPGPPGSGSPAIPRCSGS